MTTIHGTCDERFSAVRDAFASNFDQGLDVGASAAVVVDGELVVDLWGGHRDAEKTTPWERDTIINVWSTTKTMAALCALVLADHGELDMHAPVARYWPEFAASGKDRIEVRHLMSHTAGLSGWAKPMNPDDLYDWDLSCARLAEQEPWWEPGTASGYHALTQGYLIGEVVRRVTGVSIGSFFAKEIAGPRGADFHIGLGAEHDERVALVIPPPALEIPAGIEASDIPLRTLTNPALSAAQSWEVPWRRAEIPAAGGHGNARSVALAQSHLHTLSRRTIDLVFEEQSIGTDLVLMVPLRFGIGYGLPSADVPIGIRPRTCYWGGWGGSLIVNDLDARTTVAYVMNRMGEGTLGDVRGAGIIAAALTAAGTP